MKVDEALQLSQLVIEGLRESMNTYGDCYICSTLAHLSRCRQVTPKHEVKYIKHLKEFAVLQKDLPLRLNETYGLLENPWFEGEDLESRVILLERYINYLKQQSDDK